MFNAHAKFEVSTITCNEDNYERQRQIKNSRFEQPFRGLRVMYKAHPWLD